MTYDGRQMHMWGETGIGNDPAERGAISPLQPIIHVWSVGNFDQPG